MPGGFDDFPLPIIAAGVCVNDGTFRNNKNCKIVFHGGGSWEIDLGSPAGFGTYICLVTMGESTSCFYDCADGTPTIKTIETRDNTLAAANKTFAFVFFALLANTQ